MDYKTLQNKKPSHPSKSQEEASKKLKGLNYKSMGRDLITNQ